MVIQSRLFIIGAMVAFCVAAHGECRPIAPDIQSALSSPRWPVRRDAFERIAADPSSTLCPAERRALIRLQDTEDHASEFSPVDLFEDDEYVAYHDQVMGIVQKIAVRTNEPAAWRSLVYARYTGDSHFGQWLARHRGALPFLEQQLDSRYDGQRGTAIAVVALRLFYSKSAKPGSATYVSPRQYRRLKARIRGFAAPGHGFTQIYAIEGLGAIGNKSDIPLLERIAQNNTDPDMQEIARDAIRQIQGDKQVFYRLQTQ